MRGGGWRGLIMCSMVFCYSDFQDVFDLFHADERLKRVNYSQTTSWRSSLQSGTRLQPAHRRLRQPSTAQPVHSTTCASPCRRSGLCLAGVPCSWLAAAQPERGKKCTRPQTFSWPSEEISKVQRVRRVRTSSQKLGKLVHF